MTAAPTRFVFDEVSPSEIPRYRPGRKPKPNPILDALQRGKTVRVLRSSIPNEFTLRSKLQYWLQKQRQLLRERHSDDGLYVFYWTEPKA